MTQCPNCGAETPQGEAQCGSCGAVLDVTTASFQPVAEREQPERPEGVPEGPLLVLQRGRGAGERFYIDRPELTVGRDPESDIFLNDVTVSRRHAVLRMREGDVSIEDAGSLNGTYVNGLCVDEAPLADGDIVQVGTFRMVFFGEKSS